MPPSTTHGWVGDNPQGYTTNRGFHAWIDGGYFVKLGGLKAETLAKQDQTRANQSAIPSRLTGSFRAVMDYIVAGNKLVETAV